MQSVIETPIPATRPSLVDARQAYFHGDFDRCLQVCGQIQVKSLVTVSEIALLSARAYLRLKRPADAQAIIAETVDVHRTLDASLTAQMLAAQARIRQGDPDDALERLAAALARSEDAHVSVRSELAFSAALAYWAKRDIDSAERHLADVDRGSDIIHARALELLAFCYTSRNDFRGAADLFRKTIVRLGECKAQDNAVLANAISLLSVYASEFFDSELNKFTVDQAARLDWSAGLRAPQFITLNERAFYHEFRGQTVEAYQYAAEATDVAPNPYAAIVSWADRSIMASNAGEQFTALMYVRQGLRLLDLVQRDNDHLRGEERMCLMTLAEASAAVNPNRAAELFAEYMSLEPTDAMSSLSGDIIRERSYVSYVQGLIVYAQGNQTRAIECFRTAFTAFSQIGFVRRAASAAFMLVKIANDTQARAYLLDVTLGVENFITRALAALPHNRLAALQHNPTIKLLSQTQREVVLLMCAGKTNKEIADSRGVSEQTVKNLLTKRIYHKFGVSNRAKLVSTLLGNELPASRTSSSAERKTARRQLG